MTTTATRYRAIRKIAEGGSAEVFLAEQLGAAGFKRPVVLKRIRSELYADPDYRELLLEEAKLAMALHHSNLVEVLDLGEAQGHYFLVLELVDGWTLGHVMRRGRDAGLPVSPSLATYIAAELCRGLAYAHERTEDGEPLGIVHRDVCPSNVLLSTQAEVKLIDFGIARARNRAAHTGFGRTKGKPAWMSPEQAMGDPLDARSDLFSVGSVLFALLADVPPFMAPNDLEVLELVSNCTPNVGALSRPGIPTALAQLVLKAMSKDRDDRFASAQEMLNALEELQHTVLQPAGRSELQHFLRMLSARDGDLAITRQPLTPGPSEDPALSSEQTVALTTPGKLRRQLGAWAATLAAVMALTAAGLWLRPWLNADAPAATLISSGASIVKVTPPPEPALLSLDWEWQLPPPEPIVVERESPLQISAKLAPKQRSRATVAVVVESHPSGALIKEDDRELGRTPATLNLKKGKAYDLSFEANERAPTLQRLRLIPRAGKPAQVTLEEVD